MFCVCRKSKRIFKKYTKFNKSIYLARFLDTKLIYKNYLYFYISSSDWTGNYGKYHLWQHVFLSSGLEVMCFYYFGDYSRNFRLYLPLMKAMLIYFCPPSRQYKDRSTPAQPLLLSPGSSSAVRPVPTSRGAARHVIHSCTLVVRLLAFSLVYMNIWFTRLFQGIDSAFFFVSAESSAMPGLEERLQNIC